MIWEQLETWLDCHILTFGSNCQAFPWTAHRGAHNWFQATTDVVLKAFPEPGVLVRTPWWDMDVDGATKRAWRIPHSAKGIILSACNETHPMLRYQGIRWENARGKDWSGPGVPTDKLTPEQYSLEVLACVAKLRGWYGDIPVGIFLTDRSRIDRWPWLRPPLEALEAALLEAFPDAPSVRVRPEPDLLSPEGKPALYSHSSWDALLEVHDKITALMGVPYVA